MKTKINRVWKKMSYWLWLVVTVFGAFVIFFSKNDLLRILGAAILLVSALGVLYYVIVRSFWQDLKKVMAIIYGE